MRATLRLKNYPASISNLMIKTTIFVNQIINGPAVSALGSALAPLIQFFNT